MSAIYAQVLLAVKARLEATASLVALPVKLRKRPQHVGAQDQMRQLIVAPRDDLAERVVRQTFGGVTWLVFEVYVGVVVNDEWSEELLLQRMQWREDIRQALWEPQLLGLSAIGEFDVDYDPSGPGEPGPARTDVDWQRFDYKVSTQRYSAA